MSLFTFIVGYWIAASTYELSKVILTVSIRRALRKRGYKIVEDTE